MNSDYVSLINPSDEIHLDESFFEDVRSQLLEPKIVIVKGFIAPEVCNKFVNALLQYAANVPENDPEVVAPNLSTKNYHRHDVNPPRAQAKRIFHEFNLNNLDELPAGLRSISIDIFRKLLDFQNSLAETNASLGTLEKEDVALLHPQVIHYPRGGGWFEDHVHPFHPQKFELILGLTGKDAFSMGGTFFDIGATLVYVGKEQNAGDLTLFKYDLRHGVSPVDAFANELGFGEATGRWVAVLPYYSQTQLG